MPLPMPLLLCHHPVLLSSIIVAHSKQQQMMTFVIIHHLVPVISKLGWDKLGMGVLTNHLGATLLVVMWHLVSVSVCSQVLGVNHEL